MEKSIMPRIGYLDSIRGTMILWMLVVHISLNYGIIKFGQAPSFTVFTLMSFFMVPFYVFSGFLFSSKRSFKEYTMNKVRKLTVPYVLFTLFGIIIFEGYSFLLKGNLDWSFLTLKSFIATAAFKTNTPCWFFVSLFLVSEIYYLLASNLKCGGGKLIHVAIFLFFLGAFVTKNYHQWFGYGNVLLGLVYFHMGHLLRIHETTAKKYLLKLFIVALLTYCVIAFLFPTSLAFVTNMLVEGYYSLNFLFSLSATFLLWVVFQRIPENKVNYSLQYIGQISLVVFASHRPILNWIVDPTLRYLNPNITYTLFLSVSLIALLCCSVAIEYLLSRYAPKLIGK